PGAQATRAWGIRRRSPPEARAARRRSRPGTLTRRNAPRVRRVRQKQRSLDRSQVGEALGDRRLAVRGLVLVDDALGHGLVQLAGRDAQRARRLLDVAGLDGLAELPHLGAELGLDRLVALVRLLVRLDALDLRLDVRHADTSFVGFKVCLPAQGTACPPGAAAQKEVGANMKDSRTAAAYSNQVPVGTGSRSD